MPLALRVPPLPTDLFDYELPPRLIAQTPAERRDRSRLLVIDRATRKLAHHTFAELPKFLRAGDTLFRNNAAVLPARLHARRPTGGEVECFLLQQEPTAGSGTGVPPVIQPAEAIQSSRAGRPCHEIWRCLIKPGRRLAVGATFAHPSKAFTGEILEKHADGTAQVRFTTSDHRPITAVANELGDVPLPPYIERDPHAPDHDRQRQLDLSRYQTVYANAARQVAVAAPTAGLHFTPELLAALTAMGVRTADVTLHVGLGTFQPISTATIEEHRIHRELYEIPASTQRALFPPLTGRRIAVGTTSVRTIEDFLSQHSTPRPEEAAHVAEAGIFIYPPREFCGVDALITNFHQPRSTLLCLVSAFLTPGSTDGIAWIREIYAEAIAREYRFFSYGDAMLIL
ncbi:tRNA preQ1(34) S-adenosylmethionine ribosyltransferase-isomerase QueA [Opitutus terrae]|uniref:S-adenosylmethionine:tRNA ribosyltransferase-isomerase n=1 Tax=Opitutus terrae (strain DSM 11246 / JCM 15787 / PB90-1) TaxID=452637 RepID=B1ZMP2_OPITP|nr:tRNA preQ1(34) S-adenosylmethionine ribosyltransferase-isomerase QueA [Opitutus terrae]ACB75320.1 S-adenosylmethionine--tRNA-ribosyltransferase-isomerase [Opitutus terrae PB90-1]